MHHVSNVQNYWNTHIPIYRASDRTFGKRIVILEVEMNQEQNNPDREAGVQKAVAAIVVRIKHGRERERKRVLQRKVLTKLRLLSR